MKLTPEQRSDSLVLLGCEVCHEETVLLVPPRRADHGVVDCPHCWTTYVVSLVPLEEPAPTAVATPPQTTT